MTNLNNIEAFIFDCDGVLVDSEVLSCKALNIVFDRIFGIDIGTDYSSVLGTSLEEALNYYLKKFKVKYNDLEELKKIKEKSYFDMAKNSLTTFQGIENVLELIKQRRKYLAVASSGSKEKINFSLKKVNLLIYFDTITSADEVIKGKPNPHLFLKAAEKGNINPKSCVVVEDTIKGVQAGKTAGMGVIGFGNTYNKSDLLKAGADYYVSNYFEFMELILNKTKDDRVKE